MNKLFFIILMCLTANLANASSLQGQIKEEFGSCYVSFPRDLDSCRPSSCVYQDMTDSKAWKAKTIIGMVDKKCYVTYYSYIGQKIISDPDHCFYTQDQRNELVSYYRRLFKSNSSVQIVDLKKNINYLTNIDCRKNDKKVK